MLMPWLVLLHVLRLDPAVRFHQMVKHLRLDLSAGRLRPGALADSKGLHLVLAIDHCS